MAVDQFNKKNSRTSQRIRMGDNKNSFPKLYIRYDSFSEEW